MQAVGARGRYDGDAGPVFVFSGEPPATATTYLMDRRGKVVFETFGMPPVRIVQGL